MLEQLHEFRSRVQKAEFPEEILAKINLALDAAIERGRIIPEENEQLGELIDLAIEEADSMIEVNEAAAAALKGFIDELDSAYIQAQEWRPLP